jgi:hypothetical protein
LNKEEKAVKDYEDPSPSASSQIKEILILGIVFLIVVSGIGIGFFSVVKNSQIAASTISTTKQTPATSPVIFPSTTITGIPYIMDNLSSNPTRRWDDDGTMCAFRGGSYHVLVHQADTLQICGLVVPFILDNVAIEVDVSLHQLLVPGCLPLFTSDGLNLYFYALTAHFGQWLAVSRRGRKVRQWQVEGA